MEINLYLLKVYLCYRLIYKIEIDSELGKKKGFIYLRL